MGSSHPKSSSSDSNSRSIDLATAVPIQRCSILHQLLILGPRFGPLKKLLKTIKSDENADETYKIHISNGLLDLSIVATIHFTDELETSLKNPTFDFSKFWSLLVVHASDDPPSKETTKMYSDVLSRMSDWTNVKSVIYAVPKGQSPAAAPGLEVEQLGARFHQYELADIKKKKVTYEDIMKDVFHEVLFAKYSKRPTR